MAIQCSLLLHPTLSLWLLPSSALSNQYLLIYEKHIPAVVPAWNSCQRLLKKQNKTLYTLNYKDMLRTYYVYSHLHLLF